MAESMTRTLTAEQWDVIRAGAYDMSSYLLEWVCRSCQGQTEQHRTCREKQEDADAIRKAIKDVEGTK